MSRVPPAYRRAIATYGPLVNAVARKRYGISGQQLLARLTQGESGFRMGAVSGAGARGATQFMPGTRADYIKRYGIDPWSSPQAAEHATALYLKGAGGDLQAYNPNDPSYVPYILGQRVKGLGGKGLAGMAAGKVSAKLPGTSTTLTQLVRAPVAASSSGIPAPSFSAESELAMPKGFGQIPAGGGPAPLQEVTTKLKVPSAKVTVAGGAGGAGASADPQGSPLLKRGKIIGLPYQGTHTLGNWQSDNAIDISVPVGTPVYANASGRVTRAGLLPGQGASGGGRFAGQRVQIGDEAWYGHLSKLAVKLGQRVRKGQLIGYSGEANGVAHLHFAVRHGDPRRYYRP